MLQSSEIALKFPEEKIPLLPGLENDHEVRAVIALHIELTVFCDNDQTQYEENIPEVFEDLNISDEDTQERILAVLAKYEAFLKTLIAHLHSKGKVKDPAKGTFEYRAQDYIYYDEKEGYWFVGIEELQALEAKYDDLNLYDGQVVIVFNPTTVNGRMMVDTTGVKVRTAHDGTRSQMLQQFQQQLAAASQCTCGNTPCTCGAGAPPGFVDDDEEPEEPENPFEEWDELMSKATDRDIILVYKDGELDMRF
ncbi:MAG: hypothetical protein H8D23_27900 [Candidatus Brocadiales bacterium]|nr:hypothetical protein [Candidatus Brocadiales bacterium]